ncbi:hypothetical protein Mbo2_034 [Rhodococcus phage Mbo2]|uniref:Uncharacterized protein n=1 Tax=Rhodococcus phage Mbo2 TaxID=2936911 RepID=A0A9E7IEE1_9CAUD|nr:hypothetical protein Mbo2_034 [Rhodococcus phage Mbo2]
MAKNSRKFEDDNGREVSLSGARFHGGYVDEFADREEPDFNVDPADDEDARSSDYYQPVDFDAQVHNARPQQQIHQSPAAQKRTTRY